MKRLALVLVAAVALLGAVAPKPASADIRGVVVKNASDKCAWITVYTARGIYPFSIQEGDNRPGFLKPNETRVFKWSSWTQVKVRAEVRSDAVCGGHIISDSHDIRADSESHRYVVFTANLVKHGNRYNLWF